MNTLNNNDYKLSSHPVFYTNLYVQLHDKGNNPKDSILHHTSVALSIICVNDCMHILPVTDFKPPLEKKKLVHNSFHQLIGMHASTS